MTVKQFLKSKTFAALIVLVCIALVAGGLLAILNDLLAISEEDRILAAIEGIYGQETSYTEIFLPDDLKENKYGSVQNVYLLEDGNYLIKSTGINGYKNGTVTLWLVAEYADGSFLGLGKIAVAENTKQTLMGDFKASFFEIYASSNVLNDNYFSVETSADTITNIKSGATKTSVAVNNAVNAALYMIRNNGGVL